jgi:hypothetical protein
MVRRAILCISLLGGLLGCDEPANPSEILSLEATADSLPADGASTALVVAKVDASATEERRTIAFTTTAGTFVEGGIASGAAVADETGQAVIGLRAPLEVGVARVRATTGGETRLLELRYVPARPEQVLVEPEKFTLSAGAQNEIRVTAYLRRTPGRVTPGTAVQFRAFIDGTSTEIGQFGVSSLSDAAGAVTVRYTVGNTGYRNRIRLVAEATSPSGQIIGGENFLLVTD